jgi:phage anti-repressor protein
MTARKHITELIPLIPHAIGAQDVQTVNARDLYDFLGIKQRFNDWITKRIDQYEFLQDIDFTRYCPDSSTNPNPPVEYILTEKMAAILRQVETKKKKASIRYVYAIRHGNTHYVKIGVASDKHRRLERLQAGNPIPLSFIGIWETDEAIALARSRWWQGKSPGAIVLVQLRQEKLCMDFSVYHAALEAVLERPVFTHELVAPDRLWDEYRGRRPKARLADILELLPPKKTVIMDCAHSRLTRSTHKEPYDA